MKYIVSTILTAAITFALGLFLPWWSVAIAGFSTGLLIPKTRIGSFASAFTGVFILWFVLAYTISYANDHILANRISLLVLKKDAPFSLMALTALIGGITAGLSAFSGRSLAIIFNK